MPERPEPPSSRDHSTASLRSTLSHTPAPAPKPGVRVETAANPGVLGGATDARGRGGLEAVVGPAASVVAVVWGLWAIRSLVGAGRSLLAGDGPSGQVVRILRFRNTPDSPIIDGFGLTFAGWGGVTLASVQILVIAAAVVATLVPFPRANRLVMLLAGTAVAAMWAGSFVWVLAWSFDVASLVLSLIHVAGLAAMIVATWWRWRRGL